MKKVICLLLMLLLLCACASSRQAEESEPAIKESEPQVPEQVTEDENGNIVFSVDEIKELEGRKENYSRYYDEFVSEFIPSEDYGMVMPFIGRFAGSNEGNYNYEEERVGFCTADGKIVCDAVYDYRATLSTNNYVYYLVRSVGVDEPHIEDAYLNASDAPYVLIRDDGKKILKLQGVDTYNIASYSNAIRIATDYYDEDLRLDSSLKRGASSTEDTEFYKFYCPVCGKDARTDYPEYSVMWKKGEDKLIGYIHNGCSGTASVISADGEYLFTLPHSYANNVYGIDEDYAWGYYFDSMEYDDTKIKAYIYDRNTKTMHTLDGGSFYFRVSDTQFYFQGQDPKTYDIYSYIYDISTGSYTECDGSFVFGNGVSYCHNGISYVKDTNLNEIMSLNLLTD